MKLVPAIITDASETLEKLTLFFETVKLMAPNATGLSVKQLIAAHKNSLDSIYSSRFSTNWRIESTDYGYSRDANFYSSYRPNLPHLTLEQWLRACEVGPLKPKRKL